MHRLFHFQQPLFTSRLIKIDCIHVSTTPVKNAIDDLIQRLFDALLISLRRSILNDFNAVETFLNEGIETLGSVPQTIDEIGDATQKHVNLAAEVPQVYRSRHFTDLHSLQHRSQVYKRYLTIG